MKNKIVYVGPYNNSKKDELLSKSINHLKQNKGEKFYYVLPNARLLQKHQKKMIEEVGQTFDINLFTFDNVVDNLIEDYFYTNIDRGIKESILSETLKKLVKEDKLNYYKDISDKIGFIKILENIIGEIKRSLITPELYLKRCPDTLFYKEIGLIYKEYEEELCRHNLIDREGSFFKSLEILKKENKFFQDMDFIIIDEFFDFRPQELELLREIAKVDCPIYINMPFNRRDNFYTFLETLETLKDLGFKIEYIKQEELSYFEELGSIVFNEEQETMVTNSNIKIIRSATIQLEMKKIAKEIKKHYVQGTDLKDMAIVLANSNEYKDIMFSVFEDEKIPCTLDKEMDLKEIPLIKEILHILEFSKNRADKPSTINRIKSNYFSLCSMKEKELGEYILRSLNFELASELLEDNILQSFNNIPSLENILSSLKIEYNIIPKKATIERYIESIIEILDRYNIEENIIKTYKLVHDYDLMYRDFAGLNKFKEVLTNLNNLTKIINYPITLDRFIDLLSDYLDDESILEVQGNRTGINILTPVTARGNEFKVLFVAGLSQGKYPNVIDDNFFFKEENYKELKNIGIDVKNYYDKLDKESLMFTTIISACSDILYFSYSENSMGDEKDIPSMFLDEVLEILDGNIIEEKVDLIDVDINYLFKNTTSELTTKDDFSKYLLKGYYEGEYSKEQFWMYNYMDNSVFKNVNNKILPEIERNKDEFNKYNGKITHKSIVEDIHSIHEHKKYSISYLESYGKCPYYFLLNNILKVEEMERMISDFTPLDRGIILHNVLKQYYSNYKKEIENHVLGRKLFNVDESYNYIIERIEKSMIEMDMDIESNIWRIRIENNADKIINLIKPDLDRMSKLKKKVIPVDLEMEFGTREPFHIEMDGLKIPMTGTIDRVDKYIDEDKYIIIDYKNSDYSVKSIDDMRDGLSLQLPVYILSQTDKKVVAGMYGIISKGDFQLKIGDVEESHLVSKRNKGAITEEELNELLEITKRSIKDYVNSIHEANFSIKPRECSSFCIYKNICRYEDALK